MIFKIAPLFERAKIWSIFTQYKTMKLVRGHRQSLVAVDDSGERTIKVNFWDKGVSIIMGLKLQCYDMLEFRNFQLKVPKKPEYNWGNLKYEANMVESSSIVKIFGMPVTYNKLKYCSLDNLPNDTSLNVAGRVTKVALARS